MTGRPMQSMSFDDRAPWGTWAPTPAIARRLRLAHRVPRWLPPLVRLLRRPVKYGVHQPLDVVIWGRKLRLMPRGNMSEQKLLFAPQLFDPEELAFLARHLRPGDVFVDVGANAGVYTLWAERCLSGQGRILAIEPDQEMRRRIEFNLGTNGITCVEVCPIALSDREGMRSLHVNPAQRGMNTLDAAEAARAGGTREAVVVETDTLVHLLQSRAVESVRALKIDVEGHEVPILRHFHEHAPPSLWPGAIIAESKAANASALGDLLTRHGYDRSATTKLNAVFVRRSPAS